MTTNEIERIEQAARTVFGYDDGEAIVASPAVRLSLADRLRALLRKDRILPVAAAAR